MHQRVLRAHGRVDVPQPRLDRDQLREALDVLARDRQAAERRIPLLADAVAAVRLSIRPSGTSSEPSRIVVVSVSGIVSNFARYASSRASDSKNSSREAFFHFRADVLDQAGAGQPWNTRSAAPLRRIL